MHFKTKIEELIEISHKDGKKEFLFLKDGEWVNIDQEKYNKLLEGENNDNI